MTEPTPAARPLLTVLRGGPGPEELAALVAVVTARASAAADAAAADEAAAAARPLWAAPVLRGPLPHGPGAWRASGLPQ